MDLAKIYTLSRLNTSTDTSSMPDATLLDITNLTYRDLINIITSKINENFFYEEWTTPTVIGQTEYTFPVRSSSISGLKKLEAVSIKYKSTDQNYTVANPTTITDLVHDKLWYNINQPQSKPIFLVYDKSVNIFPAPTEVQSMILYWVSDPKELIAWASESDIKIPLDFHHLIVLGNEYRIYKARHLTNDKNDALIEYKNEIREMISQLSDRIIKPLESVMPNLNNLK